MFFKISVLKNFAKLEPLFNKVAGLLSQSTYGGCFWNFAVENVFFQLNLVFIADSCTGFCPGFLKKHELNLRSSRWSFSVKKVFLEILLFLIELQTFRTATLLKQTPTRIFSGEIYRIFENT